MIFQRFAPIKDENDIKVACERMSALQKNLLNFNLMKQK